LASAKSRASLFDTPRFARNLEALLITLLPLPPDTTKEGNANALFRRAVAFQHLEKLEAALADYRALVAQNPRLAPVQNNLGNVLRGLKRHAEALTAFDAALAAKPDYAIARYNRGETLMAMMRTEEAFEDFRHAAQHFNADAVRDTVRAHKAVHDAEQDAWLARRGIRIPAGNLHLEGGNRLAGPAINPANAAAVTKAWDTSDPQMVVIDNLLTPEALAELRRFCWGSTMWRKAHADGYLGAFPENGFAVPLLAQIADEMRAVFPTMLKDYPLLYAWAFKYGSAIQGTAIHADSAAVNVNFWITPDEANLDPDHGGLVVWDKAAPLDWDFARFNGDIPAARQFLADTGAKPITVPYRANRAVIFDSDLFHETDTIRFKDGYENRRINVTMLFGDRHQA
jgi:tetratricopeptide (TPR) repeat protein